MTTYQRDCLFAGCEDMPKGNSATCERHSDRGPWRQNTSPADLSVHSTITHDPVNSPAHYIDHPSGTECIEIAEHFNFNRGNAIKYIWRAGLKGETTELQDIDKAIWYLQREKKRLEGK